MRAKNIFIALFLFEMQAVLGQYFCSLAFCQFLICLFCEIKQFTSMNRWILCDNDSASLDWERKSQEVSSCFCFEKDERSSYLPSKRTPKIERKASLKTSLSEARFSLRTQQKHDRHQSRQNIAQTKFLPVYDYRIFNKQPIPHQQQKIQTPKVLIRQPLTPKFNPQVCEAYCYYPQMQERQMKNIQEQLTATTDVKIKYINPTIRSFVIPEVQNQKMRLNQNIIYKNLTALPQKINSQLFDQKQNRIQKIEEASQMSKSMDYLQPKKIKSLKSNKNLHQITCVKAESIPDEQSQDQISFVLTPRPGELQFRNKNII